MPADHCEIDPEREEAAALALNRVGEGLWDNTLLADILSDIMQSGKGLHGTGFDSEALDALLRDIAQTSDDAEEDGDPGDGDDGIKMDRVEWPTRLQQKWGTAPGQIWEFAGGRHRLVTGDSTDDDVVAALMKGQKARMCWTDPPYNSKYGSTKSHPRWHLRSIPGDDMSESDWYDFVIAFGNQIKANVTGDVYVWGASGPMGMKMRLWLIEAVGMHWSATIVWVKQLMVLSPAKYHRRQEPILYGWFEKSSFCNIRTDTDVWEIDRPTVSPYHPTTKPVKAATRAIINSSQADDIVLDLFVGSGTVFLAAHEVGRRAFGIEIDPGYVACVLERMHLIGVEAKLVGSLSLNSGGEEVGENDASTNGS